MKNKKNASTVMIILGLMVFVKNVLKIDLSYSSRDVSYIIVCICSLGFVALGFVSLYNIKKKEKTS
jgi:hypothetical protein